MVSSSLKAGIKTDRSSPTAEEGLAVEGRAFRSGEESDWLSVLLPPVGQAGGHGE